MRCLLTTLGHSMSQYVVLIFSELCAIWYIHCCRLIRRIKNVQNHPESVATTLNETRRVKNGIIVGVGNPDNWWTQDCPPQDCPPVGNTEVGNPDIHPITSPICWGPFFQAAYHALNNRAPGPNLPQIEKWQIIPEKLGPNLPGPKLLRSTCSSYISYKLH